MRHFLLLPLLPILPLLASSAGARAARPEPSAQPAPPGLLPPPPQFQPKIEDPMLEPAPRPSKAIGNWDEALGLLRASSPDDRRAVAGVERARGRWRQSLALLLPSARLGAQLAVDLLHSNTPPVVAGVTTGGPVGSVPLGTVSATVTQPIVDLSAWQGLSASEAATRGAEASLRDVRRRLTGGLAGALVAVVAAERIAELNRLGLRQALERAALTDRTRQLGAATELDVVRIRQDVEVARGTLVSGDEQLRRTREALGAALGRGEEWGVRPDFDLAALVTESRRRCTPLANAGERDDVRAAAAQLEAARASRRQATRGYLPTLGLASTLAGYTTDRDFGRFSTWSLAAVLSLPLWEGGGRAGIVRERAGIEQENEANLRGTERDVALEVARSRRGIAVAEALVKTARDSRALAARTDELTRRSFEVGRSSSLELVQSAGLLRQADVLLATREFELVQARLDALLTEAACEL